MLKLTVVEFLLRSVPEALLFVWASYLLSKTKIEFIRYFSSSIIFAIMVYLIRLLPIDFGIHVILNIFVFLILNIKVNRLKVIKAIPISIGMFIIEAVCESLNMMLLTNILHYDLSFIHKNYIIKLVCFSPSLILFIIISLMLNFIINFFNKTNKNKLIQ